MGIDIEVFVVGNNYLKIKDQDDILKLNFKDAFKLD